MQEGIHHAVPMIAFPLFAEQDYNAERLAMRGRGISLEISSFTALDLKNAIHQVTTDSK